MKIKLILMMMLSISSAGGAGKDIDKLKTELQSPDAEVRSDACLSLIEEGNAAVGLLSPRLQDRSMLVRHCAAYALSRIRGPEVEKIFRQGLTSSSNDVQRISALGLGMMGKADLEGLVPLLQDSSWEVRWSAAFALGRSGDRRALALLGKTARMDPYYDQSSGAYPVRAVAEQAIVRLNAVIGWKTGLEDALAVSRSSGRPLLLYFRRGGSTICREFERAVFTEEKIIDAAQRLVPVWLDHRADPAAFKRYRITRVPSILFLGADGSSLGAIDGTVGPEPLLERMLDLLEREKSVSRLRARLKTSPQDLETAWQLAGCYLEEGQWESARQLLEMIIKSDPDNTSTLLDNALFARAYIEGKLGNYDRACREFRELAAEFPAFGDRAEALYCWGLSELKARRPAEAAEILERLRKEYPDSAFAGVAAGILDGLAGKSPAR
ncbi:MAG: HEAT repeat domain-containing protein [PVC group bacterium]